MIWSKKLSICDESVSWYISNFVAIISFNHYHRLSMIKINKRPGISNSYYYLIEKSFFLWPLLQLKSECLNTASQHDWDGNHECKIFNQLITFHFMNIQLFTLDMLPFSIFWGNKKLTKIIIKLWQFLLLFPFSSKVHSKVSTFFQEILWPLSATGKIFSGTQYYDMFIDWYLYRKC